jgi:iron complex outermembrane recepter protein
MRIDPWTRAAAVACVLAVHAAPGAAQQRDTAAVRLDTLTVHVARLRAEGIPLARVPYGVHVHAAADLTRGADVTLADARDRVPGISTASQFGSRAQPDLRLRGFQVGPAVGFPQSVSVFVDGVRVNEPDASQINFDLIPLHAVERVEVIRAPGGPFGRNTLAGAINVVTLRPEAGAGVRGRLEARGGSFGATALEGLATGARGSFDYVASGRYLAEDGWRDLSSTQLRQVFMKVGYRSERTDAWLAYTFADNFVEGPGSLPRSWLDGELPPELAGTRDPRRLQYTGFDGDSFDPLLHFPVLGIAHRIGASSSLQLTAFARSNRVIQSNDNITEANVRGESDLLSTGATLQLVQVRSSGLNWGGGIEYVRNDSDIRIFEVANAAHPDAGGMTESVTAPEDNFGAFLHAWSPLSATFSVTGSLRFDYVSIPFIDRLDPEGSGTNIFRQITGSVGGDARLSDGLRAFASYGRGFRAPVILEISCSDPEDPCPLPFELGADPPLDPVTTDTWQAGLRYGARAGVELELVGYRADVYDDLFAVVTPPATRGYFKNLDHTRREGLELSARVRPRRAVTIDGSIAWTRATFQSSATLASALLDDDDDDEEEAAEPDGDGAVYVEPGDHFAMVPSFTARVTADWTPGSWGLTLDASFVGRQFFLGDESNDEEFGRLPAWHVLDARLRRDFARLSAFVEVRNLLGGEHHTFGIISPNVRGPREEPQPFLTPLEPTHVNVGLAWRF